MSTSAYRSSYQAVVAWQLAISDSSDDAPSNADDNDDDEIKRYNPNDGIPDTNNFAEYCKLLCEELDRDNKHASNVKVNKLQDVLTRMEYQEPRWTAFTQALKDTKLDTMDTLILPLIHGALTSAEWRIFWSGLGGWLDGAQKKEAKRRFLFETSQTTPQVQGRWTRMNLVYARRSLVGPTGSRKDTIVLPTEGQAEQYSVRGQSKSKNCFKDRHRSSYRPPLRSLVYLPAAPKGERLKQTHGIVGAYQPAPADVYVPCPPIHARIATAGGAQTDEDYAAMYGPGPVCLTPVGWTGSEIPQSVRGLRRLEKQPRWY